MATFVQKFLSAYIKRRTRLVIDPDSIVIIRLEDDTLYLRGNVAGERTKAQRLDITLSSTGILTVE